MFEELDPQYAAVIAGRANRLMVQYGIPQTPANYYVRFRYARGDLIELSHVID